MNNADLSTSYRVPFGYFLGPTIETKITLTLDEINNAKNYKMVESKTTTLSGLVVTTITWEKKDGN